MYRHDPVAWDDDTGRGQEAAEEEPLVAVLVDIGAEEEGLTAGTAAAGCAGVDSVAVGVEGVGVVGEALDGGVEVGFVEERLGLEEGMFIEL